MNCNILLIHMNNHYWRCLTVAIRRRRFANVAYKKNLIVSLTFIWYQWGATALFQAATFGRIEVVMLLLNRGADVNIKTRIVSHMRDCHDCSYK